MQLKLKSVNIKVLSSFGIGKKKKKKKRAVLVRKSNSGNLK